MGAEKCPRCGSDRKRVVGEKCEVDVHDWHTAPSAEAAPDPNDDVCPGCYNSYSYCDCGNPPTAAPEGREAMTFEKIADKYNPRIYRNSGKLDSDYHWQQTILACREAYSAGAASRDAEVAELTRERDQFEELMHAGLEDYNDALKREKGLREALREYGMHKGTCNITRKARILREPDYPFLPCNCGLEAALAEGGRNER